MCVCVCVYIYIYIYNVILYIYKECSIPLIEHIHLRIVLTQSQWYLVTLSLSPKQSSDQGNNT